MNLPFEASSFIPGLDAAAFEKATAAFQNQAAVSMDKLALEKIQNQWVEQLQNLGRQWQDGVQPDLNDKRFTAPAWQNDRWAGFQALTYLANCQAMLGMVDALQVDQNAKQKVRFGVQQWLDAMSPANFLASNPEALQLMQATQGQSLMQGMSNLFGDLQKGKLSQTDENAFEVGRNVGTSAGGVVMQNELVQLIQYSPATPKVGARPILLVPPCINKFYILDLQPDNSLVQHLVRNGHTVFMVSWRNVEPEQGHLTWDDYLQLGVVETIEVVQKISGQNKINMLGFCVGGTILATALAALEVKGKKPCQSLTLLTTFLDFSHTGTLGLMINEEFVAYREKTIGNGGVLKGQELATTFSFLRPNELVWNYVVSNYLKGDSPPVFDLLYWNSDSTNLAGPMYAWYLRNTYHANQLCVPGACMSLDVPVDLGCLDMPTYVFCAKEDHIVPWVGGYQTTQILGGPMRFVLGASGHIAGVVNSAIKNKRSYWVNEPAGKTAFRTASKSASKNKKTVYPAQSSDWFNSATEQPGSWWNDWVSWLSAHKGPEIIAPKTLGTKQFKVLEAAPGSFVKKRL